ncbi:MAG TPA: thioesterase family protein [Acidimicrobiia bacterium]
MKFRDATRVEAAGDGRWTADLAENWDIVGNTNGGYMQAIAARASSLAVGGHDPVSVTGHFTRPGHTGPITIETEIVRQGFRFSVVRARVTQSDLIILETLGTYAKPAKHEQEILLSDVPPPVMPDPESCIPIIPASEGSFPPPIFGEIDVRVDPVSAAGFFGGAGPAVPLVAGWFHLKDDEELDPFALILSSDAFPPTAFAANFPIGWTPTLELTVHIRNPRATGWIRCQFKSHFITGGFIEEDGLFWDEDDRLVAQSRQLALVSTSGG